MSDRKLCGYDLNGWSDRAARNWLIGPDGEELLGADQVYIGGAVLNPAVVRTGDGRHARWIGGAQAALAPHGRGGGWGEVGDPARRETVLSVLARLDAPAEQLAAALSGLAAGAKVCAVALDDHPARSEHLQERLLAALSKGRLGRGLLVWRSVLAVLGGLVQDEPPVAPSDGLILGVIGHVAEGFTLQRLRLRREAGRRHDMFAPERSRAADPIDSSLGYAGLFAVAGEQLVAQNPQHRGDWAEQSSACAALALGAAPRPELLRDARGDFLQILPPEALDLPTDMLPEDIAEKLAGCDLILFESLTRGPVRAELLRRLSAALPLPLTDLPQEIVARGALEAARRHSEGEPVYFDFLPQISTIVWGEQGATSFDLIEAEATLPAGRVYRSPRPARFAIQSGQSEFAVHLRKESAEWPRKARVEIGVPVSSVVPVALSVEQVPAAGRARLIIEAPMLSRQFTIDWDGATEIEKPWKDLVAELDDTPATIPKRLVLPCGIAAWEDTDQGPGLASLLAENASRKVVDWAGLATRLASRLKGHYCISSDGLLPDEVPPQTRELLDRLTERALLHVKDRIAGRIEDDNQSLKFLTWQFRRSPPELPALLLEAWEARTPLFRHPFILHQSSWVLVCQGLGRTCRGEADERSAIARLFLRPIQDWSYRQETAAAAFLLSRSDTAPLLLERSEVDRLVARVLFEFHDQLRSDYTKFNYAPFLMAGLLRCRLKMRNALVIGQDPSAEKLAAAVERAVDDFGRTRNRNPTFNRAAARYEPLMHQLLDELRGQGGNPDLLLDLYDG
ncbi:hypothetical protein [Cereibacter sediminicola]|uniref:hypothetical protein n=1 Tax=Cereibacter sediminicola TaxID=2584941 RepID=UPI0011A18319|nr:hypothetical protein [Cereibacter sediminicola]